MKRTSSHLRVLLVSLCLAISAAGQSEPKDRSLPSFHQINSKLYRGAQPGHDGFKKLAGLGIKTVVNLRDDDDRAIQEEEEAKAAGLIYFNIPLKRLGSPSDLKIKQVLALIDEPVNQPVFVHCRRGADRTGTVIAIYRMRHDGWTSEQAKAEANHHGMGFWHLAMKNYIHDYYQRHIVQRSTAQPK